MWGLALAAGGAVFLPAALDLLEGRALEKQEKERLSLREHQLRETDRLFAWFLLDPEADDKLYEDLFGRPYRRENHPEPPPK